MNDVVALKSVTLVEGGVTLLDGVDWEVGEGERWVVLGPNGAGKSTLARLVAGYGYPSRGTATVLGERFGRVDLRELRRRIGYSGMPLARLLRPELTALQAVATGPRALATPYRQHFPPGHWDEARALLDAWGVGGRLADRRVVDLSEGERQRVLLARALFAGSELLVLDEPTAGLDLGGRERLLTRLAGLDPRGPLRAVLLVTHHLEEIPPGFDRAVLLRDGRVVTAGRVEQVLTARTLSDCFGVPLDVHHDNGRWSARAPTGDAGTQGRTP